MKVERLGHREPTLDILKKKWSETVENSMIQLSRPQSRTPKARNQRGGGGGWAENGGGWGMHPLVDFAPSRTRLDTRQSYLIEFLVVSDHFFVRISSVGSL